MKMVSSVMVSAKGEAILMTTSLPVDYFRLPADQSDVNGQYKEGGWCAIGNGISKSKALDIHDDRVLTDQGLLQAQLSCHHCLRDDAFVGRDLVFGRFDFEQAPDFLSLASRFNHFPERLCD
jgi:hypothetical protein